VQISEDGAFTIPEVLPGKYVVRIEGYRAYVKSVRLGAIVSEGPVLNLNQGLGGAAVTVTLSSAFGEISGTVQDDKGPAAGAQVMLRDSNLGITIQVWSQADGTYSIKSVAPGVYKLLVVQEGGPSSDDFDELGESVEVRPKESVTRDLRVRPLWK
jgi:hypothetical protein